MTRIVGNATKLHRWAAAMAAFAVSHFPAVAVTPSSIAGLPASQVAGRGATLPFTEYEAENADSNGKRLGPDRSFTTLASEASGREAVMLDAPGRFVEFTLEAPANAVTVRYAIPDSIDGGGLDARLGIYVGGVRIGELATTSRYGWFYGAYPFTNRPSDGKPHHFYDEARLHLGRMLPAGTQVRLMVGPQDRAPWYAIDLADFEQVPPPLLAPAGAVSVLDHGADPSGRRDSYAAIRSAMRVAKRRRVPLWLPPGTFRVDRHIAVDRITIAGAGPWHSVLRGDGVGLYGRKAPNGSRSVVLRDFALIGEVKERVDKAKLAGIGGAMGGGSVIENLWIQHHKVGLWFDGPMDGIRISRIRILDNTADGLNFRRGVSNAVVENSFVRNSGDDGLAMWSHREANRNNSFRNNTVIAPNLANGIAIYGGRDIEVIGNLVADSITQGGGIHLGNRFDAVPFSGTMSVVGNLIARAGSFDPNWRFGVGALWFYALDAPIGADIQVRDNEIVDSTMEAVQFIGKPIEGVRLESLTIRGATHAFQLRSPGSASVSRVTAEGLRSGAVLDCDSGFSLRLEDSDSDWLDRDSLGCRAAR